MALIKCKECGKDISSTASACPHCGAPTTAATSTAGKFFRYFWLAIKILVGTFTLVFAYTCAQVTGMADSQSEREIKQARAIAVPSQSTGACQAGNFSVSEPKFRKEYENLRFTATVTNRGSAACGVQLKISMYDKAGAVIETTDFWPASVRNIEPGAAENFSYFIRHDPAATNYDLKPINARVWAKH